MWENRRRNGDRKVTQLGLKKLSKGGRTRKHLIYRIVFGAGYIFHDLFLQGKWWPTDLQLSHISEGMCTASCSIMVLSGKLICNSNL